MVICLSITGMLCKHDIVLDIRRPLKNKMRLLKKTSIFYCILCCSIWYIMLNKTYTHKKSDHLNTLNREVSLYKAEKTIIKQSGLFLLSCNLGTKLQ